MRTDHLAEEGGSGRAGDRTRRPVERIDVAKISRLRRTLLTLLRGAVWRNGEPMKEWHRKLKPVDTTLTNVEYKSSTGLLLRN